MYKLKVTGMTCGGCVSSIESIIKTIDSKAESKIDLKSGLVQIKSDKKFEPFLDAIEDAGFSVEILNEYK